MRNNRTILAAIAIALTGAAAAAQPTPVANWTLARTVAFDDPINGIVTDQGRLLVIDRFNADGGLYEVDAAGVRREIWTGQPFRDSVANITCFDIAYHNGYYWISEANDGEIYRVELDANLDLVEVRVWTSGFNFLDDDPTGIAIAGPNYTGPFLQPDEAFAIDVGNNGLNAIYKWSTAVRGGEEAILANEDGQGVLGRACDIHIYEDSRVFITDTGEGGAAGEVYELLESAPGQPELVEVTNQFAWESPMAVDHDPVTGDLLVLEGGTFLGGFGLNALYRVDLSTGGVTEEITGFDFADREMSTAIHITADGQRLFVFNENLEEFYEFTRTP